MIQKLGVVMKLLFACVTVLSVLSASGLSALSNPFSAYSSALEAASAQDNNMKNFLAPAWFFLPTANAQQTIAKERLSDAYKVKFLTYPSQVAISPEILEKICPINTYCSASISAVRQCQDEKAALQKQCSAEKDVLTSNLEQFAKNLEAIKAGYNRIYMTNIAYTSAVKNLLNAYDAMKAALPTENKSAIVKAIKNAYDVYLTAQSALNDLNKSFADSNINVEVSVPNGLTMRRSINLNIKAANLGLKELS